MAATAQINARINPQLKATGDAALEQAGISATQYIRMMWEYATRCKDNPDALLEIFEESKERKTRTAASKTQAQKERAQAAEHEQKIAAKQELVNQGAQIYAEYFKGLGLPTPTEVLLDSDLAALKENHMQEKYGLES